MLGERKEHWVLVALVLLGLVVKLLWLDRTELAHDEPFTVYMALRTWADLFKALHEENNPPLYFVLMKLWTAITPLTTAWLRVPSAVFSALAVWPIFLLARSMAGIRVAVVASLLFLLNNYHYGFAHEVRAYSLFTLLAVTSIWQLRRLAMKGERALLWLVMVNIALVYTHFFGWLMIGVGMACVLIIPDLRPARKGAFIALGAALVSYLPYATIFMERFGSSVGKGTWLDAPAPEELYNMIWRWSNAPVIATLLICAMAVALFRTRFKDQALLLGSIWTLLPLFGMFLVSYRVPMFLDRYLVYAAPGFCLLAATSMSLLVSGRWAWAPSAAIVGSMAVTFTPWKDDGHHPSRIVAQVRTWCSDQCTLQVEPSWYWLNFLAAEDISKLRSYDGHGTKRPIGEDPRSVSSALPESSGTEIVVDAGSLIEDPSRRWYSALKRTHPTVDSVESDIKVWVYRFRR